MWLEWLDIVDSMRMEGLVSYRLVRWRVIRMLKWSIESIGWLIAIEIIKGIEIERKGIMIVIIGIEGEIMMMVIREIEGKIE